MRERVLITGLGVVSPIGTTIDEYWARLLHDTVVPQVWEKIAPTHCGNRLSFSVPDQLAEDDEAQGRATAFAIHAVRAALKDADLSNGAQSDTEIGIALGVAMGNHDLLDSERAGLGRLPALGDFCYHTSAIVADRFDLRGPNYNVSTACSSSGYSVATGADVIRHGLADVMIAGGTETLGLIPIACFNQMKALDPQTCRPFDSDRAGTVAGEGAAILVLESESHWRRRGGPPPYAIVAGSGWSCDGFHVTAPEPSGKYAQSALNDALARAGVSAHDIDCVVAHATGTRLNDVVESHVIRNALYSASHQPYVFAPKSKLGHSGGAAGAFSTLTGALILRNGEIPPTANLQRPDVECGLRIAPTVQPCHVRHLVINSYAFGGNNISLVLTRYENEN